MKHNTENMVLRNACSLMGWHRGETVYSCMLFMIRNLKWFS